MNTKNNADAISGDGESYAKKVFLSSLFAIYIYDTKQGSNVCINPEYTRLTGYTLEDLMAASVQDFLATVHPEDRPRVADHLQQMLDAEDGEIQEIEYRFRTVSGRWIWCLSRDSVFERDVDGSVRQIIGAILDITNRKSAEQALFESEQRLSLAIHAAGMGSWDVDLGTGETVWSETAFQMLGYPLAPDARGSVVAWRRLIHPDDAQKVTAAVETARRERSLFSAEHRIIRGDDERLIWVQPYGRFVYDDQGEAVRFIGVFFDTTERKTAEMQLVETTRQREEILARLELMVKERTAQLEDHVSKLKSEISERKRFQAQLHQLSRVFMDAADPIIIEDLSGTIIDMNREAERAYGWSRNAMIGKSIKNLLLPERLSLAWQLRARCLNGQEVRNWEGFRVDKYGRVHPILLTAFPLMDANGTIESIATITKDISTLKQLETELRNSHRRLQRLSRKSIEALEIDRRGISRELHDSIGGNLAAIKFSLEKVVEAIGDNPDQAVASLEKTISNLADTIKDCKRISVNLRPSVLDDMGLLPSIEWHVQQFRQHYSHIHVIPQIDVEEKEVPEPLKIVIYRVLQEALSNAARHSQADTVHIRLKKTGNHLHIEVEDNGRGFDFQRISDGSGVLNGFGMKSMQERVEIMGGSFSVISQFGAGTRVSVMLPVDESEITQS